GSVWIAALTSFTHPFVSIQNTSVDNDSLAKIRNQIEQDQPGQTVLGTRLVCYNYPRLGYLITMSTDRNGHQDILVDLTFEQIITVREAGLVPTLEGEVAYSLINLLPESGAQGSPLFGELDSIITGMLQAGARRL